MRPKSNDVAHGLRDWPVTVQKALVWWFIGLVTTGAATGDASGLNVGYWLGISAFLGASIGGLYWAVSRQVGKSIIPGKYFLVALGLLYVATHTDWEHLPPSATSALLAIGLYAAYVGAGLLVLYFAVRVVRAAWRRGGHAQTSADRGGPQVLAIDTDVRSHLRTLLNTRNYALLLVTSWLLQLHTTFCSRCPHTIGRF